MFVEAHRDADQPFDFFDSADVDLRHEATMVYLGLLKQSQMRSASDWEKAVHELASPLDFIYSNSDFFSHYLTRTDVSMDLKKMKLQDFRVVTELLINRLHQFRFAFAGLQETAIKPERVDLYRLCMPITHLWHHEARQKSLKFLYDDLKGIKPVFTDRQLLQFVIFNLISNAIKYSHRERSIRLYAKVEDGTFTFGVSNHGIVISEEEQNLIFESGFRTEAARKKDARGMGIGLGVARMLIRRMEGNICLVVSNETQTVFEIKAKDFSKDGR